MSGWDDDPPVDGDGGPSGGWDSDPPVAQPPQRSLGQRVLRGLGLDARAVAHGVMALPNLAGDAINGAVNLGIRGVNAAAGTQIPELGSFSGPVNRAIDAITPTPETAGERVASRIVSDLATTGTGMSAAAALGRVVGPVGQRVAQVVQSHPVAQGVATTTMATGGALGREQLQGADPQYPPGAERPTLSMGDIGDIAGTVIGAIPGAAIPAAVNVGRALVQPMTQAGREAMTTQAMLNASSDPATLPNRLANGVREIVPGSLRTTAEVANDPGLMGVERSVRNMDPRSGGAFALRDAARTDARNAAADMAPRMTPEASGLAARTGLDAERTRMAAEVNRLYDAVPETAGAFVGRQMLDQGIMPGLLELYGRSTAFTNAVRAAPPGMNAVEAAIRGMPAELQPTLTRLNDPASLAYGDLRAMAREVGNIAGRAQASGDRTLATAAGRVRDAIETAMGEPGGGLTPQQLADHRTAVAARRGMGAAYDEGAVGDATARNQFGRPEMRAENVPNTLLAGPTSIRQLEAAAGSNPQVLEAMRGAFMDNLRRMVDNATPTANGTASDSAARFHRFLQENQDAARILFGAQGLRNLQTIAQDFTSRQMVDNVGRAVGSNTAQNLSVANVLANAFGGLIDPRRAGTHPLMRAIAAPYRLMGAEQALREMLTQAMLDPDFAHALAARATPQMMRFAVSTLNRNAAARFGAVAGRAIGGAVGPVVPGALAEGSRIEQQQAERQ